MKLSIYGASDDLIEFEGDFREEYSAGRERNNGHLNDVGRFVIGGILRVIAFYDGTWSFSIGMVSEEVPIPDRWKITVFRSVSTKYSMQVDIDTDGDPVTVIREM